MKKIVFYLAIISSIISFFVTAICNANIAKEFSLVILYPVVYGALCTMIWPYMRDKTRQGRITAGVFLFLQWLRAVLFPMLSAVSGYLQVSAGLIDSSAATKASFLFLFEMVVTFVVVYLVLRFSKREFHPEENVPIGLRGNTFVYIVFVFFALGLYIWLGEKIYTFFSLDLTTDDRASMIDFGVGTELKAVVDYGLSFAVILLICYCYKRYSATKNKRFMYCALLVGLARIGIISAGSEGRLAVLYPIGTMLILLPRLFQEHKKIIVRSVTLLGVAVLGLMTVYKVFHAFLYDSYMEAIQNTADTFDAYDAATQLDIYFYGVRNIAKNIYVSRYIDLNVGTFFIDFFRNTFGVHYLLGKYTDSTTIALYNLFIYSGEQAAGHLYSALAYGSTYFSVAFAPLATVINILAVFAMEKWLRRMKSIDSIYVVGLAYTRMAYNMFACFPMSWNNASRTLVLGFLVIGGASLVKGKRKKCYKRVGEGRG